MTDELKDLMEQIEQLENEMNEEKMKQLTDKMEMTYDEIEEQLDRNLELLKRFEVEQKIEEGNQAEPEIVSWCKLNKIITKWTKPYQNKELRDGYIAYKIGYLNASKEQRELIYTIEDINAEMN